jgi:hypothetical protein
MARRSPRKKAISPEAVVVSEDEGFNAVASDASDQYVSYSSFIVSCEINLSYLYRLEEEEDKSFQKDNNGKRNKYGSFVPFVQKKPVLKQPESVQLEEDDL